MDIYKAIKKERSHFKIFLITMVIIAFLLPITLAITGLTTVFYILYVIFMELLIVISIIIRLNTYLVEYRCINNKLIFKVGLSIREYLLICDKVIIVHTNKSDYDLEIVVITNSKFKNNRLRIVEKNFLRRYPQVEKELNNINQLNPKKEYYFQVIKRGGLKKYLLLDLIYRNCVKAIYTDDSIQNIKISRGQLIV